MATSLLPPGFDQPEAPVPPVPRVPNGGAPPDAAAGAQTAAVPATRDGAGGEAGAILPPLLPQGWLLRHAPHMSLSDLAARTRLPQDELAALDRGDISRCGGDFYLRAHLTCIAAALQVEPDALLLSFDRRPPARLPDGTLGMRAPVRHRRRATGRRLGWSLLALMLLAGVALAGYQLATRQTTPQAGKQHAAGKIAPPARHAAPATTALPPPVPPGTVAVALSVKGGPTWLLAQDQNGATIFEGTVPDGGVQMLRGASVRTVIGNAGAVTPTCNYHRGAVLGGPGQVVTTTFAPGVAGC